jgi:hypothetical protein
MRTRLIGLTVGLVVLGATAIADEPAKKDKDAQVREVSLKDIKLPNARGGNVKEPTVITSDEELKKAFPDEETQTQLKKEVDFSKQKMLFFAWAGSGGDQLTFTEEKGEKELAVILSFQPGKTKDLRSHHKLLVMPKDAMWSFAKK